MTKCATNRCDKETNNSELCEDCMEAAADAIEGMDLDDQIEFIMSDEFEDMMDKL